MQHISGVSEECDGDSEHCANLMAFLEAVLNGVAVQINAIVSVYLSSGVMKIPFDVHVSHAGGCLYVARLYKGPCALLARTGCFLWLMYIQPNSFRQTQGQ